MQKYLTTYQETEYKKIIDHGQVVFILQMRDWFNTYNNLIHIINHIDGLKGKNHIFISIGAEIAFDKHPMCVHDRNPSNLQFQCNTNKNTSKFFIEDKKIPKIHIELKKTSYCQLSP